MRIAVVVSLVTLLSGVAAAQSAGPDFSGTWVRQDSLPARTVAAAGDASFRRGDMGVGWGPTISISQRPDSLILEYDFFSAYDLQPRVRFAYAMDGSESRNGIMLGHAEEPQLGRLTWQGNALVITTRHPLPAPVASGARYVEVRHVLTLDGGKLTVEATRGGVAGGAASTIRATYARK